MQGGRGKTRKRSDFSSFPPASRPLEGWYSILPAYHPGYPQEILATLPFLQKGCLLNSESLPQHCSRDTTTLLSPSPRWEPPSRRTMTPPSPAPRRPSSRRTPALPHADPDYSGRQRGRKPPLRCLLAAASGGGGGGRDGGVVLFLRFSLDLFHRLHVHTSGVFVRR